LRRGPLGTGGRPGEALEPGSGLMSGAGVEFLAEGLELSGGEYGGTGSGLGTVEWYEGASEV